MENKNLFITTTLPYIGLPHIGHMFEFIIGDALTRFFKLQGNNVFLNTGLDCHGTKIKEKADDLGLDPLSYIESVVPIWKDFCKKFDIEYDNFYLTSDKFHYEKTFILWSHFLERGNLYKKKYSGLYC